MSKLSNNSNIDYGMTAPTHTTDQSVRDERNRFREENESMKTDNRELSNKYKTKTEELDQQILNLKEVVVKHTLENQELRQKHSVLHKAFNSYKLEKNSDIQSISKNLDVERQQKKWFETRLRVREHDINDTNERLTASRKQLMTILAEKQEIKERESALIVERHLLRQNSVKLVTDCRKYKDRAHQLTERCTESDAKIAKLELLAKKQKNGLAAKSAKEMLKLKSDFNKQIIALKTQISNLKKSSDLSKKNHLLTEYQFKKHENIYKRSVKRIHDSVYTETEQTFKDLREEIIDLVESKRRRLTTSNTKHTADVIRENRKNSETINTNADKINQSIEDGSLQCPECDRNFKVIRTLRLHLKARHFRDSETDNNIIDSIDLADD